MAINFVEKHAAQIDERFTAASVTGDIVNNDVEFIGAKTVKIHSVGTVPMNNYQRTGSNRYGIPDELEDTVQEMTMSQDRSFTYVVDKGNSEDDAALNAGAALAGGSPERAAAIAEGDNRGVLGTTRSEG
jgi:hypothetical protein